MLLQFPVKEGPLAALCVEGALAGLRQEAECLRNLAVDELGTELDRGDGVGFAAGPDATANSIAGFEDQDRATRFGEGPGGRKSRGSCPNNHDVPRRLNHGSISQFPYPSL